MNEHWTEHDIERNGISIHIYKCAYCPNGVEGEDRAWNHWRGRHAPQYVAGKVVDKDGKPVRFETL